VIGVVTDSNAQLPASLAERHGIRVVPLPVILDGEEFAEGVDLDVEEFYRRLAAGAEVSTSQPSPGRIAVAYQALVADGCTEIVSIHVGSALSGTVNGARLAADLVDVPVEIVDTGQASFSVGCAALAAAKARKNGASTDRVASAARATAAEVRNVFVMGGLELALASGRVEVSDELHEIDRSPQIPVMTFDEGELVVLGSADTITEATAIMVEVVRPPDDRRPLRVGVGVADRAAFGFYDAFEAALTGDPALELIRYRCGPTVGAFTGLGTVGAVWCPRAG